MLEFIIFPWYDDDEDDGSTWDDKINEKKYKEPSVKMWKKNSTPSDVKVYHFSERRKALKKFLIEEDLF